jgi:hypothetical protein
MRSLFPPRLRCWLCFSAASSIVGLAEGPADGVAEKTNTLSNGITPQARLQFWQLPISSTVFPPGSGLSIWPPG